MAEEGSGGEEMALEEGVRYLNKRIQSSSQIVMVLAAGIVVPMTVEHSNKKQQAMHWPTELFVYVTFMSGLSLRGLVSEFLQPRPGRRRYVAIKTLVHVCALLLVSLSFSLSLMMRMYVVVTSLALAAALALVALRLWLCAWTALEADLDAFRRCEEEIQQLVELSANVASILFGGWYGMAFFYFQNYPEEARDARFLPSEYLTFFTSVGSSLILVKAVPRKPSRDRQRQPVRELMVLVCALVTGVVATALTIAASKVGGYATITLVPEAVALVAWCARRARGRWEIPVSLREWLRYGGAQQGEPASHNFVSVSMPLLLAVLTYRAKDVQALSSLFDEVFVMVTAAAVVAALVWRLLTQPPTPVEAPEFQAAAKIMAISTFLLLVLSVFAFLGVMLGL